MKIKNDQLELILPSQSICRSVGRRQRWHSRASVWFDRMRQVVDSAVDYPPAPISRSQDLWIIQS